MRVFTGEKEIELTIRSLIVGLILLFLGLVSLFLITTADWAVGSKEFSFGWRQFVGSLPSLIAMVAGIVVIRASRFPRRGPNTRVFLLIGALSGIAAVLLALIAREPGRTFPYDSTTGPLKAYKNVIRIAGISGTGVCLCAPTRTARIQLPGGFETKISIYDRGGGKARPGLVIAHGNVWMGDNLSTYRLIGSGLAKRGFIIATLDFPGFGEADSPYAKGPAGVADAADRVLQLNAVVDYLIASTDVDQDNIAVFGHSGGVQWAMRTASANPNVSKVAIMVAPPPPKIDDVSVTEDAEYSARRRQYFTQRGAEQYRFIYGEDVPEWNTWELNEREIRYPNDPWEPYIATGHKPILLLLGERDQPGGHTEVLRTFEPVTEPKHYVKLHRSDHYANAAQVLGFVVYDVEVSRQLLDSLAAWLDGKH